MADCHLGAALSSLPSNLANIKRGEMLRSFLNTVEFAKTQDIPIVLIAGDLFDSLYVSRSLVERVANAMGDATGTSFFICSGNHDPIVGQRQYMNHSFPKNVHIFDKPFFEEVYLAEQNLSVLGCSTFDTIMEISPFSSLSEHPKGAVSLAIFHGDIYASAQSDTYKITKADIERCGFTYLALGHIHAKTNMEQFEGTCFAYSGCLDSRGFDEKGDKGFLLYDITDSKLKCTFVRANKRNFEVLEANASNEDFNDNLHENLLKIPADSILKLTINGETEDFDTLISQKNLELLDGFFYVKLVDNTSVPIDLTSLADEKSLTGIFISKLTESELDKETLKRALKYGISALKGDKIKINDD